MDDQHLYLAWRWWFRYRDDSDKAEYLYEALQREKERRRFLRARDKAEMQKLGFVGKQFRRKKA